MARQSIDFKDLDKVLLNNILRLIPEFVPGGKQVGNEYVAESIYGGAGRSFSINLQSGVWKDFSKTDHAGVGLLSLYKKIYNIEYVEAARILADIVSYAVPSDNRAKLPSKFHRIHGNATGYWVYKNARGYATHVAMRFDPKDSDKKQFSQWHFDELTDQWIAKASKTNPLYKLNEIMANPDMKVIICEGEKSADAAQKLFGSSKYVTTCWLGGASAWKKTDFSPLFNRDVAFWPDHDEPGYKCMTDVFKRICSSVKTAKMIQSKDTESKGFDAADLLDQENIDFKTWVADRTVQLKPPLIKDTDAALADVVSMVKAEVVSSDDYSDDDSIVGAVSPFNPTQQMGEEGGVLSAKEAAQVEYRYTRCGLAMKSNSTPFQTEENICRILFNDPIFKDKFYFDTFYRRYFTTLFSSEPEEIDNLFEIRLKMYLQRAYMFNTVTSQAVSHSISAYMSTVKHRNTMIENLEKTIWDKKPRVDEFFVKVYGAQDTKYMRDCGRIFWLSIVNRIMDPGSKVDTVIILEGAQGIKKSTSLELIAGKNYSVAGKDISSKDFFLKMAGKTILEIAELNAFSRSDHNELKEVISTRVDHYRVPYGHKVVEHPRTCIFVGTTNENHYLNDETGSRRFLPVACQFVNWEYLKDNLDQFYAEALARVKEREDFWSYDKTEHAEATFVRSVDEKDPDPWYEIISDYVRDIRQVKTLSIFTDALGIMDTRYQTKKESNRIGRIMRRLGRDNQSRRDGFGVTKVWVSADDTLFYKTCDEKRSAVRASQVLPPLQKSVNNYY